MWITALIYNVVSSVETTLYFCCGMQDQNFYAESKNMHQKTQGNASKLYLNG